MAARLVDAGFDVELRGALNSPYSLTVGDMARIDVYVPHDQVDEATMLLLVDEVDEADEILDDDRPPVRRYSATMWWAAAAALFVFVAGPVLLILRWY